MLTVLEGDAAGGEQRLVVQRTMRLHSLGLDKTLVISLSRSTARIEAGWHSLAWTSALAWLLTGVIGAVGLPWRSAAGWRWNSWRRRATRKGRPPPSGSSWRSMAPTWACGNGRWPATCAPLTRASAAMLGYAPDELGSTSGDWRALIHPDDLAVLDQALAAASA